MTTNVRDSVSHTLAADSRWSIDLTQHSLPYVLYVDDADYQKLISFGRGVFMFAGDSKLIDSWKFAIGLAANFPNAVNWDNMPTTGLAVTAVDVVTGAVLIDMNPTHSEPTCAFAGTGATHARQCWQANRNAEMAVETAKKSDIYSGGTVRYYRIATGEHNIGDDRPLSTLNASLAKRGYAMKMENTVTSVPISEAVKADPMLKSVIDEVSKGNINATAPHSNMDRIWTEGEKRTLVGAMEHFFPKSV